MSTDLAAYLNYMSTWDGESDANIDAILKEHGLFVNLGDFNSDTAINDEFNDLYKRACDVRDRTIAADATQIAADAAAIGAIWSFGIGMAAFAALEAGVIVQKKFISKKSDELNKKLQTVDTDISAKINTSVKSYIEQYKKNNELIARKAPKGLDTRTCRGILMQFLAHVQQATGKLDVANFKKYAESARTLYNSKQVEDVYNALDTLNLSDRSDEDVKKYFDFIKGFTFDNKIILSTVTFVSVGVMFNRLKVANKTISTKAAEAGIEVAEVETSTFKMLGAVGKVVTVIAVAMSVVDIVLDVLDIVDVVEQCKKMCDELNGRVKTGYKDYFDGIKKAAKAYNEAVAAKTEKPTTLIDL